MTKQQGVGIWEHYRTNETPKADGLMFRGEVLGESVEARLYWAPADWRNPNECGKRPYVVVKVFRGEYDSWTGYEYEFRWDNFLGDERPRRNWKALLGYGSEFGMERLEEYVDNAIWYHEEMIANGCVYENHTYYYPHGVDPKDVMESVKAAWDERKAGYEMKAA